MFSSKLFSKSSTRKRSKSRDREQNYQQQQAEHMAQQVHRQERLHHRREVSQSEPVPHYVQQKHQQQMLHEKHHRRYHKEVLESNNNNLAYPDYDDYHDKMVITAEDVINNKSKNTVKSRNQLASASQESKEIFRTAHSRDGLNTVHTQRIIRKVTTLTSEEKQNLEDDELLRERLIRWAQKSTEGYSGVKVKDLTTSWKDGLAFNAILHRNRPELLDYRLCRERTNYENLENAFDLYDQECGIEKLLKPEQVDNFKQDETALFHYIYAIYQKFPNPPARNPLLDDEKLMKIEEYKDRASRLLIWIRENLSRLQNRDWPNTIEEMKLIQQDHNRFRNEEIPLKLKEKQNLMHFYREICKYANELNVFIDHELSYDNIDIFWNRLLTAHQQRDQAILDELARLEKLERFAEKVAREIRITDQKLDEIERMINEEEKKVRKLHPLESKFNIELIENEIRLAGEKIKQLFQDVAYLKEQNYHSVSPLLRKVEQLHEKWSYLNIQFQERVVKVLAERRKEALRKPLTEEELIATKEEFRFLDECIRWVRNRMQKLNEFEFGSELSIVKNQVLDHKGEAQIIANYQINVDKCVQRRSQFKGEELSIYSNMLERLRKLYTELCGLSEKRTNDLQSLLDFLQKAVDHLNWLADKEEHEVLRDWSLRNTDFEHVNQEIENLKQQISQREAAFNQTVNKGESLIRQKHPAKKTIDNCLTLLQLKWIWLSNISKCSTIHLKHSTIAAIFREDAEHLKQKLDKIEQELNSKYSKTNFSIEEGEELIKGMQELKHEINSYSKEVNELIIRSKEIVPMDLRRPPLERPIKVKALFTIKQNKTTIHSDEVCTLKDNSTKSKWRLISSAGYEVELPGVCFTIPPPDQQYVDLAESLKQQFEALIKLWAEKFHKLRVNLIFATLNIVKEWDYDTYINMDPKQREQIIKALDDDIERVVKEGPPNDPDSKRLQDEMRALKKKFAEFDERYKNQLNEKSQQEKIRKFVQASDNLLDELREKEKILIERCEDSIPRSIDSLSRLLSEHREFEQSVKKLESRVDQVKKMYSDLPKKNKETTDKHNEVVEIWARLNKLIASYSERLKDLSPALNNFIECSKNIKNIETKLNIHDDKSDIKRMSSQLRDIQTEMHYSKYSFEQLITCCEKVKLSVAKTRPHQTIYSDVDSFENDCKSLLNEWNLIKENLKNLQSKIETFSHSFDKINSELNNLKKDDALIKPISCDHEIIKQQKSDFKQFLRTKVEPLGSRMEEIMKNGEDLIASTNKISNYLKIDSICREVKKKMDDLNNKWNELQNLIKNRVNALNEAIELATKFWEEHSSMMQKLKEIKQNLIKQQPPALEPMAINEQKQILSEIKTDVEETAPKIENIYTLGKQLMSICAEREKPEIRKNLEELDSCLEQIKSLISKREKLLNNTLDKAQQYHLLLQEVLDFLEISENKLENFGEIPLETDLIKKQIKELKDFKYGVESYIVEIERLNKLAKELIDSSPKSKPDGIKESLSEVNKRWEQLIAAINNKEKQLENSLFRLGQFQDALKEFQGWINKIEQQLKQFTPEFVDLHVIELEISKHKNILNEIKSHKNSMETLNKAGELLIESEFEDIGSTKIILKNLNEKWNNLSKDADHKKDQLEEMHEIIARLHNELLDLINWVNDVDNEISSRKQFGGLPDSVKEQMDKFMLVYQEIFNHKPKIENLIKELNERLANSQEHLTTVFRSNLKTLTNKWETLLLKAEDIKNKLEQALKDAMEFDELLNRFLDYLSFAENCLLNASPVSKILKTLELQIEEHNDFHSKLEKQADVYQELDKKATQLKYFCQKQDVLIIKNQMTSVLNRWEKVQAKSLDRLRQLELSLKEVQEFNRAYDELMQWITDAENQLNVVTTTGNDAEKIRSMLLKQKEFQRKLVAKQVVYEATMKLGKILLSKAPKNEIKIIQDMLDELRNRWNALFNKSINKQRKLEEALLFSGQFKEAIKSLLDWLELAYKKLDLNNLYGDLDTVNKLMDQHKSFTEELRIKAKQLASTRKTAKDLIESASLEDKEKINQQLSKLELNWAEINSQSDKKTEILQDALKQAEKMHKMVHGLLEWLSDAELKLRFQGPLPEDEYSIRQMIKDHEMFIKEMAKQEVSKNSTINFAEEILTKAHSEAVSVINHWITIIQARWDEVASWSKQWSEKLTDLLNSYENVLELIEQLLNWLTGAENSLTSAESQPLPDDIDLIEQLIKKHQLFIDEMTGKQDDFERIIRIFSNQSSLKRGSTTSRYTKRWRTSTQNLTSEISVNISDIKNPKVRELVEKWKIVWQLAMDRLKRLQEKLDYLNDVEKSRNFSFDEWKQRFLNWIKNQRGRLLDFFKKIDQESNGKLTYDEFIEGFLQSKFPTCRVEMDKVAPIFDRNFDTYIDQKEFLDTLRSEIKPKSDDEIIMDEVQKQVSACNCLSRYRVYQVGEGKYRFGESQTLRLVRILRSSIMVRVGGGWVTLDEFLIKNDPCRLRGKTNIELKEHLNTSDGAGYLSRSQQKLNELRASTEKLSHYQTDGPITKIREKTERSLPMNKSRVETTEYTYIEDTIITTGPKKDLNLRCTSRSPRRNDSDLSTDSIESYIKSFNKLN